MYCRISIGVCLEALYESIGCTYALYLSICYSVLFLFNHAWKNRQVDMNSQHVSGTVYYLYNDTRLPVPRE